MRTADCLPALALRSGSRGSGTAGMAKLGEGDKRWIVEGRTDGANVNQWHWTERDETVWAKTALKNLICGNNLDGDTGHIKFGKDFDHWEGDVLLFNRKGKQTLVYNLEIRIKWTGKVVGADGQELAKGSGKISIYELSEEALEDGLEITIDTNFDKSSGDMDQLRGLVKQGAAKSLAEHGLTFHSIMVARLAELMSGGPPAAVPAAAAACKAPAPAAAPPPPATPHPSKEDPDVVAAAEAKTGSAEATRLSNLGPLYQDAVAGTLSSHSAWDLSCQGITDTDIINVLTALLAAETGVVASVDLAGNELTDAGLQEICIALGKGGVPSLMKLNFRNNRKISEAGRNMFKGLKALRGGEFEALFDE